MVGAAKAQADERAPGDVQRKGDRVRLVGHQAVHPERHEPVHDDRERRERRVHEDARLRVGIAAAPEVAAPRDERDDGDAGDDRALVEAAFDVEDEQRT